MSRTTHLSAPLPARRGGRRAVAALLVSLALVTAACGGSGDDEAAKGGTETTAGTGSGTDTTATGPRTFEHAWGSTEIDGVPERIVSLDPQFTDALLAIGVTPVAYVTSDLLVDGGITPWQDDLLDGVEQIDYDGVTYSNQDVYNAQPDAIVGTFAIENQQRYDDLSDIAPTIGSPDPDREVQRWQDLVTLAGDLVGRPDDAAKVISDTEADLEARADELPGLDGKTYTFVNYVPGDALYIVADPDDGASEAFATLGLTINPEALAAADGKTGRAKFSLEQVDLLDADVILILANGGDPDDLIGFDTLRAAKSGAVVELDMLTATALNQPSSLSLPWVLDQIEPALRKAES